MVGALQYVICVRKVFFEQYLSWIWYNVCGKEVVWLLTEVGKVDFSIPAFVSLENTYILDNIGKIPPPLCVSPLSVGWDIAQTVLTEIYAILYRHG